MSVKKYELAKEMQDHLYEEYGDRFESVKKIYPDFSNLKFERKDKPILPDVDINDEVFGSR